MTEEIYKKCSELREAIRMYKKQYTVLLSAVLLLVFGIILSIIFSAPRDFPVKEEIEIPEGYSLVEAVELLHKEDVVRSRLLLQLSLMTLYRGESIQAASYYFPRSLSLFEVGGAITKGEYVTPPVRVTIPEGLTIEQTAELVAVQTHIKEETFLKAASGKEGFLYPDTYFIPKEFRAEDLVFLMEENFFERIEPLRDNIDNLGMSLYDVVIMASLIEREANTRDSRALVSGILWKRIEIDMPLQVDATFSYLLGKTSAELTRDDLALDSPYNTYTNRGLPPTPIASPGFFSLEAAVNPKASPYLFYLTGSDGNFYYAEDFDGHVENKRKHL